MLKIRNPQSAIRNQLAPDCVQDLFESAANAAQKGLAQYFTPLEVGRALARLLPEHRPVLADLHCGHGQLLDAAANDTTRTLLGCDIQRAVGLQQRAAGLQPAVPCRGLQTHGTLTGGTLHRVTADITKFYSYLHTVGWLGDVFTLNPPWDHHQYREPLTALAESKVEAVREAFAAWDGRTPRECIDSCVAALCIALDRSAEWGEGFLIGNRATLERLILLPNSPHHALGRHVWMAVDLGQSLQRAAGLQPAVPDRELQTPGTLCPKSEKSEISAVALFFARGHDRGNARGCVDLSTVERMAPTLRSYRHGLTPGRHFETPDSVRKWKAAIEGFKLEMEGRVTRVPNWNIYLAGDGTLRTQLSLYDHENVSIPKEEAESLFELNGQRPMQLVVQRPTRNLLLKHAGLKVESLRLKVEGSNQQPATSNQQHCPWRVEPAVLTAIEEAMRDFQSQRAPLWPLSPTMRLGWLDEEDAIRCVKDLNIEHPTSNTQHRTKNPKSETSMSDVRCSMFDVQFRAGQTYPLKTITVTVRRKSQKRNLAGEYEDVELSGKEIAFIITDEQQQPRMFRIVRPNETECEQLQVAGSNLQPSTFNLQPFPLDLLLEHFEIPDVPDIASVQPERYQFFRDRLLRLEALTEQIRKAA